MALVSLVRRLSRSLTVSEAVVQSMIRLDWGSVRHLENSDRYSRFSSLSWSLSPSWFSQTLKSQCAILCPSRRSVSCANQYAHPAVVRPFTLSDGLRRSQQQVQFAHSSQVQPSDRWVVFLGVLCFLV